jgi:Holliday junction resolvasome RuvABC DNA-binding subunit
MKIDGIGEKTAQRILEILADVVDFEDVDGESDNLDGDDE